MNTTPDQAPTTIEAVKCVSQLDDGEFQLRNDPPKAKPASFENGERTSQRVLIDGMDCLPGQQDLF